MIANVLKNYVNVTCIMPLASSNKTKKLLLFLSTFANLVEGLFCLFVFVALRPMSTAMVIAGRSVHLTTLFLGRLEQAVNQ